MIECGCRRAAAAGHAVAPQHDLLARDVTRSPILDRGAVTDHAAPRTVSQHGAQRREFVVMHEAALGELDARMQRRHRLADLFHRVRFCPRRQSAPSRAWYSTSGIGLHWPRMLHGHRRGIQAGAKTRP